MSQHTIETTFYGSSRCPTGLDMEALQAAFLGISRASLDRLIGEILPRCQQITDAKTYFCVWQRLAEHVCSRKARSREANSDSETWIPDWDPL